MDMYTSSNEMILARASIVTKHIMWHVMIKYILFLRDNYIAWRPSAHQDDGEKSLK